MAENWHEISASEVAKLLKTGFEGLRNDEAARRLLTCGKNQIHSTGGTTFWKIIAHQFSNFMILILIATAIVSGYLGDLTDTFVILAIIFINAFVGFIQEYRAEKAIESLKKYAPEKAKVVRGNKAMLLSSPLLVPGDVVILEAGDRIPADVRFFEAHQVMVDESALTGESGNVTKDIEAMPKGKYSLGDRRNIGYKGTFITKGRALGYVTETGMQTELGRIAELIHTGDTFTPLQKRLSAFSKSLSFVILITCALIFFIGWIRGEAWVNMLLTALSLAVAAIPEALPAIVTIALAFGAKDLVKKNTLIRKLSAVETLGSVTYICTDKTGTLTLNKMTVMEFYQFTDVDFSNEFLKENVLLNSMTLNNDVVKDNEGKWVGDSTETAMVEYVSERKLNRDRLEARFPRVGELPFDAERKCMTTIHQSGSDYFSITKGALDVLCKHLTAKQKHLADSFLSRGNEMAEKGYRVLGFAVRELRTLPPRFEADVLETDLNLIGIVGLQDPPRLDVKSAVSECRDAGIIPVMITGDHSLTATAIARQIGIINAEKDLVLSGSQLDALDDNQFSEIVEDVRVYARVNPEQKLRIVKSLQSRNQFVAMTGDGVNDAPALKNAEIGIAMGISGTEVAKESSDMILMDDNFSSIVSAIKHGRRIYDNILKFIRYIMTGNSGEIWAIFLAPFFGLPIPLLPIHILWINLVTDGLPGLALASEPAEKNIMKRPPLKPGQNIFSKGMSWHILWVGFLMGVTTLGTQAWAIRCNVTHWQTMAFSVLCFLQLGHVLAIRTSISVFKAGLFSNKPLVFAVLLTVLLQLMIIYLPWLNGIFKTQPLTLKELLITLVVSTLAFWVVEIEKRFKKGSVLNA